MHAEYLDRYSRLTSPVHRLWAGAKLAAAVVIVVAIVSLPRTILGAQGLATIALLLLVIAAISRIPWKFLVKRMLWLEPFAIGVALLSLFQADGWRVFLWLVARSSLCLLTMLLLSNTTPYAELLRVMRRVKVPAMLVTTLALMYRYLFVMMDETGRMRRARASRTFSEKKSRRWRSAATVVSQLFIRVSERSERIFAAMCARGWQ